MADTHITVALTTRIDLDHSLLVEVEDNGAPVPVTGLAAICNLYPEATRLTLEIRDFVHDGEVFQVDGAAVELDGRSILAYWQSNDNGTGQSYTFDVAHADTAAGLLISATPRRRGVEGPGSAHIDPMPRRLREPG